MRAWLLVKKEDSQFGEEDLIWIMLYVRSVKHLGKQD